VKEERRVGLLHIHFMLMNDHVEEVDTTSTEMSSANTKWMQLGALYGELRTSTRLGGRRGGNFNSHNN
jgi:hypothetical protein